MMIIRLVMLIPTVIGLKFVHLNRLDSTYTATKFGKLKHSMISSDHIESFQTIISNIAIQSPDSAHSFLWTQLVQGGIADASATTTPVCPDFGQPGWAPFCFLNGNPVFNAFDEFQLFIQNSVVSLRNFLHDLGIPQSYGLSIVLFTFIVRLAVFPLTYQQLSSSALTQALNPKVKEIREKYPDNKDLQNTMVALLYQETQVNPLAGCLPAIFQIPIFIALYRSFLNLAQQKQIDESFLWLPNLDGPVYGQRSADWLFNGWHDQIPSLGWHDTLCFLSLPLILVIAQKISLQILTPPSDDPAIQRSKRILQYLPLMIGYFSLSVPAGLAVYWITNNVLSTVSTAGIKEFIKQRPPDFIKNIDIDKLAQSQASAFLNPAWGYSSQQQMIDEALFNYRPPRNPKIPANF